MGEWFEKKTLGTLLEEAARRWGPREALFYEGQRWSFAHLQAEVDGTARAMMPSRRIVKNSGAAEGLPYWFFSH
jgi:non-ribosomal peptide synthetase component E (peptide arylation enzyme)